MMPEIVHNEEKQVFLISHHGAEAKLAYRLDGDAVDFSHTFVPPELRGQGLAERLVRHGLAWAKHQGLTISASCWYVQKFL